MSADDAEDAEVLVGRDMIGGDEGAHFVGGSRVNFGGSIALRLGGSASPEGCWDVVIGGFGQAGF